ncbi:plexin-C1 [Engraulis encrasicolus]|uniref:plexin-C1 n=1 Tax=Engraulis encrasicolus TaxID=184585 RepID=UPI002FCF44E0
MLRKGNQGILRACTSAHKSDSSVRVKRLRWVSRAYRRSSLTVKMGTSFLLCLLVICSYTFCEKTHWSSSSGDIVNFAFGIHKLFVQTDTWIYQMSLDFTLEISNGTNYNTMVTLVPFLGNGSLIVCGSSSNNPYCEVLDINDISKRTHKEGISIGSFPNVAFLIGDHSGEFLLVAIKHSTRTDEIDALVTLRSTSDQQPGGIFSKSDSQGTAAIKPIDGTAVEVVDGFELTTSPEVYLFVNVMNGSTVKLLSLDSSKTQKLPSPKTNTIDTLQGAVLQCYAGESWKLLSSAVIPGVSPVLWAGVFENKTNPSDSVVAIFNISRSLTGKVSGFCKNTERCDKQPEEITDKHRDKVLTSAALLLKKSSIRSVAALRSNYWIVLFCGTETGLLIRVVLDQSFKPGCPTVLYSSHEEQLFSRKMLFNPVIHTHIYLAQGTQMRKIPIAQCDVYRSLSDCWSAIDPFCGWCVSDHKCTFEHDCSISDWLSVPGTAKKREVISVHMNRDAAGQDIVVTASPNLNESISFSCSIEECVSPGPVACSCSFSSDSFPAEGLSIKVNITVQKETHIQKIHLKNCSSIRGAPTSALCKECISAGCEWSSSGSECGWRSPTASSSADTQDVCEGLPSVQNETKPEILSMTPSEVSIHGRKDAIITGKNLKSITKVRFQGTLDCTPKESQVLYSTSGGSEFLKFDIPRGTKGTVRVCVLTPDDQCHGTAKLTYDAPPTCRSLQPKTTWASGGRNISILGSKLKFVEQVWHDNSPPAMTPELISETHLKYISPTFHAPGEVSVDVSVGNQSVRCSQKLSYLPNPQFTGFTATPTGNNLDIVIQKTADSLGLNVSEIQVEALSGGEESYECEVQDIEHSDAASSVICEINGKARLSIETIKITVGGFSHTLKKQQNLGYIIPIPIVIMLALCVVLVVLYLNRKKQKMMRKQMRRELDDIECDIRNKIREGFVDMQTERSELISSTAAIPFLDYKHFASRIFFPEGGPLSTAMMNDVNQLSVKEKQEQSCHMLSQLLRDQLFLTSFVHALEEQKSFQVKDKCMVASLLTLALHDDLPYLTQVMERLLSELMEQPSNAQPKLLLRRTESIVEKLLTNWMSICLYGFLRECVGQPLYLLVCALMEQTSKGPVDSITGKALYTLSEDWLLWQAQDFKPLRLTVLFAVGTEGEVSEPLEICALDCDTVEQVKEKILLTFHRKFGFRYTQQLRDIDIEYEREGCYMALQEVDSSTEVKGNVIKLNTLKHYKVADGSTIKVITRKIDSPKSPTQSLKEEPDFETKYCHLIDPEVMDDRCAETKKLKVKEIYLPKLLSTKVAVHSHVENLFRTIWGTSNNNRPLHAVKFFFDFLDGQAESRKISDPDVLHIWKTNSLPLRFWINILKNPQFVFDLEKTPHLDGCLSVIAQAFMDAFSLTDQQLGKHTPTNKLLYAKDIPLYKQEVRAYYKRVQEQAPLSGQDFKDFLQEESRKHEHVFNESVALCEIYKFMQRYFNQIEQKLEQNSAPPRLKEELHEVRRLFESKKKTSWE